MVGSETTVVGSDTEHSDGETFVERCGLIGSRHLNSLGDEMYKWVRAHALWPLEIGLDNVFWFLRRQLRVRKDLAGT